MANETEYTRTTEEVGILLINPQGRPDLNYYYCLVDLPSNIGIGIEEGTYDAESKTLTFAFTCSEGYPPPNAELMTYAAPVYFIQTENGEAVDIETVEVVGTLDGKKTTIKRGQTANQKKKVLVGLPSADETPESTEGEPAGIDEIRWLIYQSETFTDQYFVLVMIRTNNGNSRLLTLQSVPTDDNNYGLQVSYNSIGQPTEGEYVAATNVMGSQYGMYQSIFFQGNTVNNYISYDNPTPTKV